MSAFVVTAEHIATCAQIIMENVYEFAREKPDDESIRMDLAMANVISVAWRYGPEGQRAYAPILSAIIGNLDDAGWDTSGTQLPESTSDVNNACFDDEYTVTQYLDDCRSATPIVYTPSEAWMYLSCLEYQSCEPPEWEGCKMQSWICQAQNGLAYRLVKSVLGSRHVWEVREPEPVAVAS